jgi:hypothetical protein
MKPHEKSIIGSNIEKLKYARDKYWDQAAFKKMYADMSVIIPTEWLKTSRPIQLTEDISY